MNSLTHEDLFYGYSNGMFPMAEPNNGEIFWYSPDPRAIIPLENYIPHKSLKPIINKQPFEIRLNADFEGVMRNCAKPRFENDETWISDELITAYTDLHKFGFAHSIEAYQDNELVGGLYGVSIGAAFFGESMFYKVPNASKISFHYLIQILKQQNFKLLDTQFMNDNVKRFGAIEISKLQYGKILRTALSTQKQFGVLD